MRVVRSFWLAIGFAGGLLFAGLPFWSLPYARAEMPNRFTLPTLIAIGAIAMMLVAARLVPARRAAWGMALCLPAAVALRVAVETAADPTSHNLWPLELVLALVLGLGGAVPGVLLGMLARRLSRAD